MVASWTNGPVDRGGGEGVRVQIYRPPPSVTPTFRLRNNTKTIFSASLQAARRSSRGKGYWIRCVIIFLPLPLLLLSHFLASRLPEPSPHATFSHSMTRPTVGSSDYASVVVLGPQTRVPSTSHIQVREKALWPALWGEKRQSTILIAV